MLVTIAITCYNYGRYLGEAIDSALAQTLPPREILVIDDGSQDDSASVARSYGNKITFHPLPHRGICAVRNFALEHAAGDAIVFLDADDRLHPDHLLKTVRAWEKAPEPKPAFVYPQRTILQQPGNISQFPDFSPASLKFKNYVLISSLFLLPPLRSITYDPAFEDGLEDFDMILGLLGRGFAGLRVNEPLLAVRLHPQTRSLACGKAAVRSRILNRILKKHRHLYTPAEARQFRKTTRNYVLWKLAESPPVTLTEKYTALKLLLQYRAHPARFLQLFLTPNPS